MNQCDGCNRGLLLIDGVHYGAAYDLIGCTAERYGAPGFPPLSYDQWRTRCHALETAFLALVRAYAALRAASPSPDAP